MTILNRIKVLCVKAYRFLTFGVRSPHARTANIIFLEPTHRLCDYCTNEVECIILECDWEVYASICGVCANKITTALDREVGILGHRGVITQ